MITTGNRHAREWPAGYVESFAGVPEDFERPSSQTFSDAWREFVSDVDVAAEEIDPDDVFAGVRDAVPRKSR